MTHDNSMPLRPGIPWPPPGGHGMPGRFPGSQALFEMLAANIPASDLAGAGRQLRATAESMVLARPAPAEPADFVFPLATAEVAVLIARDRMADLPRRARSDLVDALDTLAAILRRAGRVDDADRMAGEASSLRQGAPMSPEYAHVANEARQDPPPQTSVPSVTDILALTVRVAAEFEAKRADFVRRLAEEGATLAGCVVEDREIAAALAAAGLAMAHVAEGNGVEALRSLRTAAEALRALRRLSPEGRAAEFRRVTGMWVAIAATFTANQLEETHRLNDARLALKTVMKALNNMPDNRDDTERLRIKLLRQAAREHHARGRSRRAARAIDRAIRIARRPVDGVDMAGLLAEQATVHAAAGHAVEAKQALQSSHLTRTSTSTDPQVIAYSTQDLAVKLAEAGHVEEAWTAAVEATERYRALVRTSRAEFLPELAECLGNAAAIASRVGRRDDTQAMSREQCDLYRELARLWPSYGVNLAIACTRYLVRAGAADPDEVVAVACEAIAWYDEIVDDAAVVRTHDVVTACQVLASLLGDGGFYRLQQEAWALYHRATAQTADRP